jgi:hypothetical protein
VALSQLGEDFARYVYLSRLHDPAVLVGAVREGVALLTWEADAFAYADSFDESTGRYRGLRGGQALTLGPSETQGLIVKPEAACKQFDVVSSEAKSDEIGVGLSRGDGPASKTNSSRDKSTDSEPIKQVLKRFHGAVSLDPSRVGRDAGRIADEVIAHLVGLVKAEVTITLDITAEVPNGVPEQTVRTVTENCRTLKFTSHGFETE